MASTDYTISNEYNSNINCVGMFTIDEESQYIWFNPASLENDNEFFLVGVVIGLALYNSTILDINFPMACYRKLLMYPVSLDDLILLKPSVGAGLKKLLEFDGDVEDTFCLSFEVTTEAFGEIQRIPLVPGGQNISVTNANRKGNYLLITLRTLHFFIDYVLKYVDYHLNLSIKNQFESFKRGFEVVCGGNALSVRLS